MTEDRIYTLREQLYLLIDRNADYNEILKTSEELDEAIVEFIYNENKKNVSTQRL